MLGWCDIISFSCPTLIGFGSFSHHPSLWCWRCCPICPFYPSSLEKLVPTNGGDRWWHQSANCLKQPGCFFLEGIRTHIYHPPKTITCLGWKITAFSIGDTSSFMVVFPIPRWSMYGIFTYFYHKHHLNVGTYTIHGSCETVMAIFPGCSSTVFSGMFEDEGRPQKSTNQRMHIGVIGNP